MGDRRLAWRGALRVLRTGALALAVGGCAGPLVLERQVLGYDDVAKRLDEKLLLLNIARTDNRESVHFTSTSSIAATFNWTTTVASGQLNTAPSTNFLNFPIGASASENPTFSIFPISGQDFTQRIATPFDAEVFEFLVFQGGRISQVMRLMTSGIEVQTPEGAFVRFVENDPRRPAEYEEFRRIADHLQWLNECRELFVRSLVFNEVLVEDFKGVPRAEDINNGFSLGLRWRQKPNGSYELSRLNSGRTVVTNFDPMSLSDRQRFEFNERIRHNPRGFVYLEIRPDGPGGDFPIRGAIKTRSLMQMIGFLANGIHAAEEFDVAPDPRTRGFAPGPAATLKINVTDGEPVANAPSVSFRGRYYAVNDTQWDRTSFTMLNVLYQSAVGKVRDVGIPITIAKQSRSQDAARGRAGPSTQCSTSRITDQRGDFSVCVAFPSIQYRYSSSMAPLDFSASSQALNAVSSLSLPAATA
jgi:hypothetical protein